MAHTIKTSERRERPSRRLEPIPSSRRGDEPSRPPSTSSYFPSTRDPIPSLAFVVPLLLLYEAGVAAVGGGAGRAGADAWLRHLLGRAGSAEPWILPAAVAGGLVVWEIVARRGWRFPAWAPLGMVVESGVFAVGLVGMSKLVDIGFDRMEAFRLLEVSGGSRLPALVGFLGAGIYEESVFRLAMIPLFYGSFRLLQLPNLGANVLAVTLSSLLFSLAHHAGSPGETFTWYVFIFRWLAGIYFAWVFVVRGFGVAVGTHAVYDILVGYFDLSF